MKIATIKGDCQVEDSKIFGECYIPDKWLEEDIFSPFEFFLCQINLAKITCDLLPDHGYLYFFVDAYSFNPNKMTAKVRYSKDEPDAYTDFNDGYFEEDPDVFILSNETEGDVIFCEKSDSNKIILLQIDNHILPEELKSGTFCFEIGQNDLKSGTFENCELKIKK